MNDSSVTKASIEKVLSQSAYILFYSRSDALSFDAAPVAEKHVSEKKVSSKKASKKADTISEKKAAPAVSSVQDAPKFLPVVPTKEVPSAVASVVEPAKEIFSDEQPNPKHPEVSVNATGSWMVESFKLEVDVVHEKVPAKENITRNVPVLETTTKSVEAPKKPIAKNPAELSKIFGESPINTWDHLATSNIVYERSQQLEHDETQQRMKRPSKEEIMYDQPRRKVLDSNQKSKSRNFRKLH
jgi:hypothetical protein